MKVGRNDPCPCGSGLKYKKCCSAKDDAARATERAAAAVEAEAEAQAAASAAADAEAAPTEGEPEEESASTAGGAKGGKKALRPTAKGPGANKRPPPPRPSPIRKRAP